MSGQTVELLDLIARWVHVIAAIMWVGNSLLFNWLDRSLIGATGPGHTRSPIGTIWLLHSGGFYYVEKTPLKGEKLPAPLHWFKWQAYTTFISGIALLIVVYYAGGRAVLADPLVAGLSHWQAVAVGVGALVLGRAFYETMQRSVAPKSETVAVVAWVVALAAISVALTQLLSGRAAFLHAGAMLGTIMAANVAETLMPSQRELVKSVGEGRGADPVIAARAKRVSLHNNYLTFPVIALMLSGHFPGLYGHPYNWLLLLVMVAAGAGVRHALNIRFTYPHWKPALAATIASSVVALYVIIHAGAAPRQSVAGSRGPLTFEDARHVIDQRCTVCHSSEPADRSFGVAPGGVMFDTPGQIIAHAARIRERAVVTRTMPPGNKSNITDAERALLGRWIAAGARAGGRL
ncbi:MAG: urate hydroxylase PuuD [Gemmatimonadaceae bacterium]